MSKLEEEEERERERETGGQGGRWRKMEEKKGQSKRTKDRKIERAIMRQKKRENSETRNLLGQGEREKGSE